MEREEEQVSEFENKSVGSNPTEEHRGKKRLKKLTEPQQLVGHIMQYKVPVIVIPKKRDWGRKKPNKV